MTLRENMTYEELREDVALRDLRDLYAQTSEQAGNALRAFAANEDVRARAAKLAADRSKDAGEAHDLFLLARKHALRAKLAREWIAERTEL
jgi:hypothetical protein